MARKIADAYINVKPDTKGFKEAANPHVVAVGQELGTRFREAFKESFRQIGELIGGFLAGREVFSFLKEATDQAREAARINRLTENVIRSTGSAANVSSQQIRDLSVSLGLVAGIEPDVVQGAENMLLSFTEVKNGVGKGNDVFNQASQAILDMSVFMNNGTSSMEGLRATALQVGKALNNPTRGMTALSRAGVVFTEQQREQIKTLQKSGDIMGAQKIIIHELEREFGGAAAAATDPIQRAEVAWHHFREEVGTLVLPAVERVANVFAQKLIPALKDKVIPFLEKAGEGFKEHVVVPIRDFVVPLIEERLLPAFDKVRNFIQDRVTPAIRTHLGPALETLHKWFNDRVVPVLKNNLIPTLQALWNLIVTKVAPAIVRYVIPAVVWLGKEIAERVVPAALLFIGAALDIVHALINLVQWLTSGSKLAEFFRFIIVGMVAGFVAYKVAVEAVRIVTAAWAAIQAVLDVALDANPIGLIIVAIGALVAAIIWVATKTRFFQTVWADVWGFLKGIGAWFAGPFKDFFVNAWKIVERTFSWDNIVLAFKVGINLLIKAWNALDFGIHIKIPSILGLPGFRFDVDDIIPDIPYLQRGGTVTQTGVAVVHEGELVAQVGDLAKALAAALKANADVRPVQNIFNLTGPSVPELAAGVSRELAWNKGA